MRRPFGTAAVVLALLCSAAPARAQNREHQQMAAELRMLQEQQQLLSNTLAQAMAQLADAIKAITARIEETTAVSRKSFADQGQEIKNIGIDLGAIRERAQETDTRIRTLDDEVEALRLTVAALPSLLAQAAQAAAAAAVAAQTPPVVDPNAPAGTAPVGNSPVSSTPSITPPLAPVVVPPPAVPAPPPTAGLSPNRLYETAYGDYASGQWTLAIGGFEQLVRTFPQSERADDAQFYIGEALVALNRFPDAIAAYKLVIQNYPKGDQVHVAYYKRGLAQERLKQFEAARASFELAIKLFPDSVGAIMAKPGLDRVDRLIAAQQAPAAPVR
jgi:TolA-binding protein